MASLSVLGRFKSRFSILCELCSSQHVAQVSKRNLSLSCPTYENKNSENQNSEKDKVYKFRQFKHPNPVERAFRVLSDDVKDFYRRKRDTLQQITSAAREDADTKAGISRRTGTAKENVYDFEPSTSGAAEAVWPAHCDVLVVGGGAVGSSIAYHLKQHARDGLSVVVVEEDPTVSQILY